MDPVESLRNFGYAVFPELYSKSYVNLARQAVLALYEKAGKPHLCQRGMTSFDVVRGTRSGAGLLIRQFLHQVPALTDGFFHPQILDVFRDVLDTEFRVEATGASISDQHRNRVMGWHHHVGGVDDHLERPRDFETLDPDRIRRLTMLVYLDGLAEETGPLVVHPRKLSDPLDCPSSDTYIVDREHHAVILGPPGTAVLVEERTWHTAYAPTRMGYRCYLGSMIAAQWAEASDNADPSVAGLLV